MVVYLTTTCAVSTYRNYSFEFEPHSCRGVLDTTLWDTFFSDLEQHEVRINSVFWEKTSYCSASGNHVFALSL
jgi:hypothetical protein